MYWLFLDDLRVPEGVTWVKLPLVPWTIVRTYEDFVSTIQKNRLPEFISFDHDLGIDAMMVANKGEVYKGYEKTGYDCAKWLVDYCFANDLDVPDFRCHSINPVGKERILGHLDRAIRFREEEKA